MHVKDGEDITVPLKIEKRDADFNGHCPSSEKKDQVRKINGFACRAQIFLPN